MGCLFVIYSKYPIEFKITAAATVAALSVRKTRFPIEHNANPQSVSKARSLSVQPRSLPIAAYAKEFLICG